MLFMSIDVWSISNKKRILLTLLDLIKKMTI